MTNRIQSPRAPRTRQSGFILLPVVLLIAVVATLSYLSSFEGAMSTEAADASLQATEARLVAEAGAAHAEWLVHQTGCQSYSMATTSFGRHQYEAVFSPTAGSPTQLTATGRLESGASYTVTRDEVAVFDRTTMLTLILQPGSEGADTYIEGESGHTDHNKENDKKLKISSASNQPYRTLIQFDLSSLPPDVLIESAEFEFELSGLGSNDTFEIHAVSEAWDEAGVTWESPDGSQNWATPGGDYDPRIEGTFQTDTLGLKTVDLTALAREWAEGRRPNDGLIILTGSRAGGSENSITSGDEPSNGAILPLLRLTYACECGVICAGLAANQAVVLSTQTNAGIGGISFSPSELVEFSPSSGAALLLPEASTGLSTRVTAAHVHIDGRVVLTTRDGDTLGGVSFNPEDLVEYDPALDSATIRFDGSAHFADSGEQITALHVLQNGDLVLSTANGGTLGGLPFGSNDLIQYDPDSGDATLYFDGDTLGLTGSITAVHVLANGRIVLGAEGNNALGGHAFTENDLIEYDPTTDLATRYFTGDASFDTNNERIRSVHILGDEGPAMLSALQATAHWTLDEGSGTVAADSVGGHDGILENGPAWNPAGIQNGALDFDGNDDQIVVPHDESLAFTGSFSISAWINIPATGAHRILSKERAGANDAYFLSTQDEEVWFGIGGSFFSPSAKLVPSEWHHVTATFDADAGRVEMYIDGIQQLSQITSAVPNANTAPVSIGGNWQSSKQFLGTLDDVRLYDFALELEEVAELASDRSPGGGGSGLEIGGGGGGLTASLGLGTGSGSGEKSGCSGTFADPFDKESFSGSSGTLDWSTDWLEINESDGPKKGDTRIENMDSKYHLQLRDNDKGGEGVEREADLSAYTSASLSFRYRRDGFDKTSDFVTLSVSSNGGSSWKALDEFAGPADDDDYLRVVYDISSAISKNTRIRFLTSEDLGNSDELYIDDVEISVSGCAL